MKTNDYFCTQPPIKAYHGVAVAFEYILGKEALASLAQLVEHALRKRMVVGSIPTGGLIIFRFTQMSARPQGEAFQTHGIQHRKRKEAGIREAPNQHVTELVRFSSQAFCSAKREA